MATNPIEYRLSVAGFGTWRITYDLAVRKWQLACNLRIQGERWEPVRHFDVVEAAAVAVGEKNTGLGNWDFLCFGRGMKFDLAHWKTEASEGVQADASDGVGE